jgi:hypothetical protein
MPMSLWNTFLSVVPSKRERQVGPVCHGQSGYSSECSLDGEVNAARKRTRSTVDPGFAGTGEA